MSIIRLTSRTCIHPASGSLFEMGECENCNSPIQEVNSHKVNPDSISALIHLGVETVESLPSETYYSEALDITVCNACCA